MQQTDTLFVLGAGRPVRGETPSSLLPVGSGRALDWVLAAFHERSVRTHFIGGFNVEEVRSRYPKLQFTENPNWASTGSAVSLLQAPIPRDGTVFVCYGDILLRPELVNSLAKAEGDVCVAIDSNWRQRFIGRSRADLQMREKVIFHGDRVLKLGPDIGDEHSVAEFIGLVLLRRAALEAVEKIEPPYPPHIQRANMSSLIEHLRLSGLDVRCVDARGDWAELNEARDIARFVMGTKAETLERLRGQVRRSIIQDQAKVTHAEWVSDRKGCLQRIENSLGPVRFVVRSSARKEDSFQTANAGVFTSLLDVSPGDDLSRAIDEVFASYGGAVAEDQVLIQPMVANVQMHGVVFTRTLDRGAPYYVINYDRSGDTEAVTSGRSTDDHTRVVHRSADFARLLPAPLSDVLSAVTELESLLQYDALDVEFAIDEAGRVHVFQVRPITVEWTGAGINDEECNQALDQAVKTWRATTEASSFLPCSDPVFGVMPDWNPAEIIGTAPGALAFSLYRFLVTDEIWATQRAEYGYRDVRPHRLLVSFAGRPYVDVRASFASFVPAAIDDALAARLVAWYLRSLRQQPSLHDKVEFSVVPTCMTLDFDKWRKRLADDGGFSPGEVRSLEDALRDLTGNAFHSWPKHMEAVALLEARREKILARPGLKHLERARLLLEDCRRYGTLPFAHMARSAFVAVALMRSAVSEGIISQPAVDAFMASLDTVTGQFSSDVRAVATGRMPFDDLVARYGHLRPGTYDISSPSYGSDPQTYLAPLVREASEGGGHMVGDDALWRKELPALCGALGKAGLPSDEKLVDTFFRNAIAGREYVKFCFSRSLSLALEEIASFGEEAGLDRTQLSNIPINMLLDASLSEVDEEFVRSLSELAASNLKKRQMAASCLMPSILTKEEDFLCFENGTSQPNFVGTSRIRAPIRQLGGADGKAADDEEELAGCIILIPQADPGYDWLFGQGIAGLVTMYGGANSHMAIRAAEFGLPAAIGVGEGIYERLSRARLADLDPANQRIEGIYQ